MKVDTMGRKVHMLTTVDNPYNPATQFKEWFGFDISKGYHSLSLLARIAQATDELGEVHTTAIIEEAIAEIVSENVSGMHTSILIDEDTLAIVKEN